MTVEFVVNWEFVLRWAIIIAMALINGLMLIPKKNRKDRVGWFIFGITLTLAISFPFAWGGIG